ncbi:MAG: hypothetical protein J6S14_15565 [Clostridia bacterium]|nr:hypothetical protein [Clostridia bacterium]
MKYILEINIQTDGDFGFQFVPTDMIRENYEWYVFKRTYTDRDKAIEDAKSICHFLRANIQSSRDSVIRMWHTTIDSFLTMLQNSEMSIDEEVEQTAGGNYDGTQFLFRAVSQVVNFKFDVTDEEYAKIMDHRIHVKQEQVKAAVLALYDDQVKE